MKLGVNVDHIATLRQARRGNDPDPVAAAVLAQVAGADSIVCHLREDRRHIQDRDLELLRKVVPTRLNLEMAMVPEIVEKALIIRPEVATLVPERREELTTEGGLDVIMLSSRLKEVVMTLNGAGIEVSLFINPEISAIKEAAKIGAQAIELHTGLYSDAHTPGARESALDDLMNAAIAASKMGLFVAAGHGLNYFNVRPVAQIEQIEELNIGHSIIARAALVGLSKAIEDMRYLIDSSSDI
jgi:pyridoxine 5-phosphate synthase